MLALLFGVAALSSAAGTVDFDAVFAAGDLALYEAKAQGRNRVCLAPADDAPDAAYAA